MRENTSRDIVNIKEVVREEVRGEGKRHGLCIGVQQHEDEVLDLECAEADALDMRELMRDSDCGLFDSAELVLNEEATREGIWAHLCDLCRKASPADTVWIYYAGHAVTEPRKTADESPGHEVYWVPYDADVNDLMKTGLSWEWEVQRVLKRLSASKVVIFLDCCYAGAMKRQKGRVATSPKELLRNHQGEGWVQFHACSEKERAYEGEQHSVFTGQCLQGLRGAADNDGDGIITAWELHEYLHNTSVSDESEASLQTPFISGEMSYSLVLTMNPTKISQKQSIMEMVQALVRYEKPSLEPKHVDYCRDLLRSPDSNLNEEERQDLKCLYDFASGETNDRTFVRIMKGAESRQPVPEPRPEEPDRRIADVRGLKKEYFDYCNEVLGRPEHALGAEQREVLRYVRQWEEDGIDDGEFVRRVESVLAKWRTVYSVPVEGASEMLEVPETRYCEERRRPDKTDDAADTKPDRTRDESVVVSAFHIRKKPVTRTEFNEFVEAGMYEEPDREEDEERKRALWTDAGFRWLKGVKFVPPEWDGPGDEVADGLSWYEAIAYCNWRNWMRGGQGDISHSRLPYDLDGRVHLDRGFRLPTETEIDIALRADRDTETEVSGENKPETDMETEKEADGDGPALRPSLLCAEWTTEGWLESHMRFTNETRDPFYRGKDGIRRALRWNLEGRYPPFFDRTKQAVSERAGHFRIVVRAEQLRRH
jgi:formylglycine-generating enzyme required for sulfatase activity